MIKRLNSKMVFVLVPILFSCSFTISSVSTFQFDSTETQLTTDPSDQFDPSISGAIAVYSDSRGVEADTYLL